jgi:hypothetical protein
VAGAVGRADVTLACTLTHSVVLHNDLSPPFGSAHAVGCDPHRAMAEVAGLDVRVFQISQAFQPLQLDVILIDLGFVRRKLPDR